MNNRSFSLAVVDCFFFDTYLVEINCENWIISPRSSRTLMHPGEAD